jgi:tetratricopeptide (TPR) repeat protein
MMNANKNAFMGFRLKLTLLFSWLIIGVYSFSQSSKNEDVQTFYKLKDTSERRCFIRNVRDYYLNQHASPFRLNYSLEKATRLLNNECDRMDMMSARINILIYSDQINKAIVVKNQLEQKLEKQSCDTDHWVSSKLAISNLYFVLKEFSLALKGNFSVLNVAKKKGDIVLQRDALYNIGNVYIEQNRIDSAEYFYNVALNISPASKQGDSEIFMGLSRVFIAKKEYEKALFYLHAALNCTNLDLQKAFVYFHLGRLHYLMGDTREMLSDYQNALRFSNNNLALQLMICIELETFHIAHSNFLEAYNFRVKRDSLDSVMNLEKYKLFMDSLNFTKELNRSQLLNTITLKKLSYKEKEKKVIITFLVVTISLLVVVGYLLVQQRRKNFALVRKHVEAIHAHSIASLEMTKENTSDIRFEKDQKNEEVKIPKELILKLEKLLMEKELYKDPNLSIQKLALKIGVGNDLLSKAINVHYGVPFRTLINNKRIELAMILLLDEQFKLYSIEGIAKSVGYINMATFYNNFKLIAGVTPTYFQSRGRKIKAEQIN